jgi:hypothetical protein
LRLNLFALNALHGAVGGGGLAGIFLAGRHFFTHGLIGVHRENFGAIVGAQSAAYAGVLVYNSFHGNTSVKML